MDERPNSLEPAVLQQRFVELLARHRGQLFNYIFCMVQTMADAEDVFQQTTIAMWNGFPQFEPGSDFLAWSIRIAHFRALGFIRSKRRDRAVFSERLIEQLANNFPESSELQDARLRALDSCRSKLTEKDQALLVMCYGGSQSTRDVAEALGRPVGAVYDSLSRIRRALHTCIKRTLARESGT